MAKLDSSSNLTIKKYTLKLVNSRQPKLYLSSLYDRFEGDQGLLVFIKPEFLLSVGQY